jgi:hypothetical protein
VTKAEELLRKNCKNVWMLKEAMEENIHNAAHGNSGSLSGFNGRNKKHSYSKYRSYNGFGSRNKFSKSLARN